MKISVAGSMAEALAIMRGIHDSDVMRQWERIGGQDLRTWMLGPDLIVGCEDGPTSARAMLRGDLFGARDIVLAWEPDAEGMFAAAVVAAMARNVKSRG